MAKTPKPSSAPRSGKRGGAVGSTPRGEDRDSRRRHTSRLFDDTPLITAFRWIRPHWRLYMDFVISAAHNGCEDMNKYHKAWLALSDRERRSVTPEYLCEHSGVSENRLMGCICDELWRLKRAEGSIITAMAQPRMLDRVVRNAEKTGNFNDRELFFRVTGQLPDRKGTTVVVHNNPQTLVAGAALPQFPKGDLLDMDEEIIELGRDFSPSKFLTTASMPPVDEPDEDDGEDDVQP